MSGPINSGFLAAWTEDADFLFSDTYGDDVVMRDMDVSPAGQIALVGTFLGAVDFGDTSVSTESVFDRDIFVAKLDAVGDDLWSRRFSGTSFFATLRQKLGWGGLLERDESRQC